MTKTRVLFLTPPDYKPGANIWVEAQPVSGGLELVMLMEYPDFKPAAGMRVQIGEKLYEVTSVALPKVECLELPATHTESHA